MSGELDERPDLTALLRNLRDRVYELEHRVSGDTNPLSLGDLEDVRVDSLGDVTITLADGDALVYRAADALWIPGTAGGGSTFPVTRDDGTNTYTLDAGAPGWGTGQFAMHQELDADPTVYADVVSFVETDYAEINIDAQAAGEGKAFVDAGDDFALAYLRAKTSTGTPAKVELEADTGNTPETSAVIAAGKVDISAIDGDATIGASGDLFLTGGRVFVGALPSADPGTPGQLYEVAGVVMISL